MQKNSIIRHFTAGFLLLLFAFSITPKQYLHDVLVRHQDTYAKTRQEAHAQLDKVGFQCDCNSQVVQLPFIAYPDFELTHPVIVHFAALFTYSSGFFSAEQRHSSLRGPPVIA